ncbi:hypothetical protein PAMA_015930 [Pampus argenteus]
MLQVVSRHTLGTHTPNPTICHPHTSSMYVRTEGSMCSYTRICIMLPEEKALSRPQESLGNWFGKASGKVCAKLSDGFVSITAAFGPGAVTEDQNREFLQRSSRYSADRA